MRRLLTPLLVILAILAAFGLLIGMILALQASGYPSRLHATGTPSNSILAQETVAAETIPTTVSGSPITVTADTVNLRDSEHKATGNTAARGTELTVYWQADGYGQITAPAEYADLFIWRGCTSDPAEYGCEAK